MHSNDSQVGETPAEFAVTDLAEVNLEPVGYLGGIAIELGAEPFHAYRQAVVLVLRHGSSRRIDLDAAQHMCQEIREWARADPTNVQPI